MQHGKSHNHRPHSTGEAAPNRKSLALLLVLLVAQLMVILDITAVNIALPNLAQDLQLTGSEISWTITSYSLVFGSLLLFGGRAADLLGRRRLFLTGLGIFTAASLASAAAVAPRRRPLRSTRLRSAQPRAAEFSHQASEV